jgi:aryl-alcohol dehydrogenase-like predicted oxidoreductase
MGVITWSPLAAGWLSGRYRNASDIDLSKGRAARFPGRFDPGLPENQRKLEMVQQLDKVASEAGVSLLHLAIAFVVSHRAVTSAIIGPRTVDQLEELLAGAEVELDDATLDRLDEISPPGTNVNVGDSGYTPPALADAGLRRRPASQRSAA